jgi:fatty-acyl-CoA synthase
LKTYKKLLHLEFRLYNYQPKPHREESIMQGLMMDYSLTIEKILFRARDNVPDQDIISRMADESIHRYKFINFYERTVKLMNVLRTLGVKKNERVGNFAWNTYRHLELYFAIPCIGSVLHTLNIRLFPEQLKFPPIPPYNDDDGD